MEKNEEKNIEIIFGYILYSQNIEYVQREKFDTTTTTTTTTAFYSEKMLLLLLKKIFEFCLVQFILHIILKT